MDNNILTIAIPTYNRPEKIKRQVLSVIEQLTDKVCVVILDNHSEVEVSSLFDKNVRNKVRFVRNRFNMGADGNIAKCFDVCETEWLWTLSDDDVISDDAVKTVLNDIKEKKNYLFINYNRQTNRNICGLEDFAKNAVDSYSYLFWISACVYHVSEIGNHMHYYYRALSTMQPGVSLIIRALSDNPDGKIYLSDSRVIVGGGKEITWNRDSFLYASLHVFDILRDLSPTLNHTIFKRIVSMCLMNIGLIYNEDRKLFKALKNIRILIRRRGFLRIMKYNCIDLFNTTGHILYYKVTSRKMNPGNEDNC